MEINKKMLYILSLILLLTTISYSESVLIIRESGVDYEESAKGLRYELEENEFEISELVLNKKTKESDIKKEFTKLVPNVVILMNNSSIRLYKSFIKTVGKEYKSIPTVSLMGSLIKNEIVGLENATGVGYEIPISTSGVNLRALLEGKREIKKIGLVYTEKFSDLIEFNRQYCEMEGIELVTIKIEPSKSKLKKALKQLLKKDKVDAIWVSNDNALIVKYIQSVWQPFVKSSKLPFIVGVKPLVAPKFKFGTYAVLPDHIALGSQAAGIVLDLWDNEWVVDDNGSVQPPLSVFSIINYKAAKKYFKFKKEELTAVDKILE